MLPCHWLGEVRHHAQRFLEVVRKCISKFLKFGIGGLERSLRPLAFGDIAHYGAPYGSPVSALCRGGIHPHPERYGILLQDPQGPRLWGARFQERFAVPVMDVLVFGEDKAR